MTEVSVYITKGTKVRANWFNAKLVGLAGAQMKVGATEVYVEGIVRHLRGDTPTNPKEIRLYVDPSGDCQLPLVHPEGCKCPQGHVEVNIKHVYWATNEQESNSGVGEPS